MVEDMIWVLQGLGGNGIGLFWNFQAFLGFTGLVGVEVHCGPWRKASSGLF